MHWHGYAWTGPRIGLSALRQDARESPGIDVQPIGVDVQLKRIAETATDFTTHRTADEAFAWLEATLQDYPRAARDPLPGDALADVRARLDRGGEVDWFYYSLDGRYVERALRVCAGPGAVEPEPHRPHSGCPQSP
ncbi:MULTISPECIES: hypothetical protein [unclassified Streptomyces]|uniref:hypothetical protein n=1 Tax=unclassified Streptomyces TaxID=2593676 RepID=UPI00081D6BD5|nr:MULTISPECIES: hypothetical protein [unclassified Streptomyces]MYZ38319.1 hypothetical protein [Streptomyces sp. SID4917]SCF97720.1 hypothetical protein GA0115259_106154 [Streptomyces sp. MnatMP-M17]